MSEIPLIWNAKNVEHIAGHGVSLNEVEEAVEDSKALLFKHRGRYVLLGSAWGRILFVVLEWIGTGYYVITARDVDKKEKRKYKMKK